VGTLGQERRCVFGVPFVDEETRATRKVERVGAAGVVGYDHGRDSRRGERRLGELCVASRGVGADLDHLGLRGEATVLVVDGVEVPVGERVVVDGEGEVRRGWDLDVGALPPVADADDLVLVVSCTQTSATSMPSPER
jgi:hypothetical protein